MKHCLFLLPFALASMACKDMTEADGTPLKCVGAGEFPVYGCAEVSGVVRGENGSVLNARLPVYARGLGATRYSSGGVTELDGRFSFRLILQDRPLMQPETATVMVRVVSPYFQSDSALTRIEFAPVGAVPRAAVVQLTARRSP